MRFISYGYTYVMQRHDGEIMLIMTVAGVYIVFHVRPRSQSIGYRHNRHCRGYRIYIVLCAMCGNITYITYLSCRSIVVVKPRSKTAVVNRYYNINVGRHYNTTVIIPMLQRS